MACLRTLRSCVAIANRKEFFYVSNVRLKKVAESISVKSTERGREGTLVDYQYYEHNSIGYIISKHFPNEMEVKLVFHSTSEALVINKIRIGT